LKTLLTGSVFFNDFCYSRGYDAVKGATMNTVVDYVINSVQTCFNDNAKYEKLRAKTNAPVLTVFDRYPQQLVDLRQRLTVVLQACHNPVLFTNAGIRLIKNAHNTT